MKFPQTFVRSKCQFQHPYKNQFHDPLITKKKRIFVTTPYKLEIEFCDPPSEVNGHPY